MSEKVDEIGPGVTTTASSDHKTGEVEDVALRAKDDDFEVFKKGVDGVEFRLVGWPRASIIFLKILFATGVLSIPTAMYSLGSVGGALSVIGWGALNTCKLTTAPTRLKRWTTLSLLRHCNRPRQLSQ